MVRSRVASAIRHEPGDPGHQAGPEADTLPEADWTDRPPRILMVDDSRSNLMLIEAALCNAGFTGSRSLTDPHEALRAFETERFDLVMLDLHMPSMDGIDFLRRLSSSVRSDEYLPVLMLTADVTVEAKRAALAAGATDFLTKPFDLTEVTLRVRNLLETRGLHLRLRAHNAAMAARLAARQDEERRQRQAVRAKEARTRQALAGGAFHTVFQPVVELTTGRVVGAEALTRFAIEPVRSPDVWFTEAAEVGLGVELELAAVRKALSSIDELPAGMFVSINVSPATARAPGLLEVVSEVPDRLVVELTEHVEIGDYDGLLQALGSLAALGVRCAVDDAGAGFSTMQHILTLQPDVIKLDVALTRGIDADPVRRALARALVSFADEIGATLVAEGIETGAELDTLRAIDVPLGQGYHLARPSRAGLISDHLAVREAG